MRVEVDDPIVLLDKLAISQREADERIRESCEHAPPIFMGTVLNGLDFSGRDLRKLNFAGALIKDVDFSGANCEGINFYSSIVDGTDFRGARLRGANFSGTTISNANCRDVDASLYQRIGLWIQNV